MSDPYLDKPFWRPSGRFIALFFCAYLMGSIAMTASPSPMNQLGQFMMLTLIPVIVIATVSWLISLGSRRVGIGFSAVALFFLWMMVALVWSRILMTFIHVFQDMNAPLSLTLRILRACRWPGTALCLAVGILALFKNRWNWPTWLLPILFGIPILLFLLIVTSIAIMPFGGMSNISSG
jgi:hypothetical protein